MLLGKFMNPPVMPAPFVIAQLASLPMPVTWMPSVPSLCAITDAEPWPTITRTFGGPIVTCSPTNTGAAAAAAAPITSEATSRRLTGGRSRRRSG